MNSPRESDNWKASNGQGALTTDRLPARRVQLLAIYLSVTSLRVVGKIDNSN